MSEPRLLLKNLATGEEVPVVGDLVAGRNEQSSLRLATTDTSKPSGTHAILRGVNGVLSVEDMQSTNGTYVNDRRLTPHERVRLVDGDRIRFHHAEFLVRIEALSGEQTVVVEAQPSPQQEARTVLVEPAAAKVSERSPKDSAGPEDPRAGESRPKSSPAWISGPRAEPGKTAFAVRKPLDGASARAQELKKQAPAGPVSEPQLTVFENGAPSRTIVLRAEEGRTEWTIGKEQPPSDIVLDFPTVSALHARLINNDGRWQIADQLSSNGTWVDGAQVNRRYLGALSVLGFGEVECLFQLPETGFASAITGSFRQPTGAGEGFGRRGVILTAVAFVAVLLIFALVRYFKRF
jgi:pSer/pThr/pTyr-binding forkhead associated (FHA) protein